MYTFIQVSSNICIYCIISLYYPGIIAVPNLCSLHSLLFAVPPKDTMLLAFPSDAVKEGDSVTISCTSTGNPAVHIVLKKKMGDVDQVLDSEGGNYTIDRAQMEHAGVYKCESRNELGQQFQNITLNVKGQLQ